MRISYNNKIFRSISNSDAGEVSDETIFRYFQNGEMVHGVYQGGEISYGTLIAKADKEGLLDMRYQHLNMRGELMTGECISTPEILDDGRIRIYEKWQWTCGEEESGESIVEEVKADGLE